MDDMLSSDVGTIWPDPSPRTVSQADDSLSLQMIWSGLARGTYRIALSWVARGRCFVTLKRVSVATHATRYSEVARRVFSGEQAKVVAMELGLSPSTVCTHCKLFLETSAKSPRAAGLAAFIAKAACAARGAKVSAAQFHGVDHDANLLLSVDLRLEPLETASLSEAERDIARRMLEGRTRAEIGQSRGTSSRTLANQIGSIYRKLGVSGRRELTAMLVSGPCFRGLAPISER
jgi:DNA-binding CsgD family transcriptional regulator